MFEEVEKMETDLMQAISELQSHCSNTTQFFAELYFDSVSVLGKKKNQTHWNCGTDSLSRKREFGISNLLMMTGGVILR